jgi:hypothetical protein
MINSAGPRHRLLTRQRHRNSSPIMGDLTVVISPNLSLFRIRLNYTHKPPWTLITAPVM